MKQGESTGVVVIGGGIVGCSVAYYLGKLGVKCTIVEQDTVAGHSSGFALGGLNPLGVPGPLNNLSLDSFRLHQGLSESLKEETGIDTEFELHTSLVLAYSELEAHAMQLGLTLLGNQEGFTAEWKNNTDILAIEPRLAGGLLGGIVIQYVGLVEPYKLALGFLQAAEKMGSHMRHGTVTGLKFDSDRVTAVLVGNEEIPCDTVVLAMGAWSRDAANWIGMDIPTSPLKGQILRLRVPGPPMTYVSWGHNYAVTKPDDVVWVGTTEEDMGFDETPTLEARKWIMESVVEVLPHLMDAQLVRQTACLRPATPDNLPFLGKTFGKEGVIIATGGGRKGIHLSPVMGKIVADLVVKGNTSYDISSIDPCRGMS